MKISFVVMNILCIFLKDHRMGGKYKIFIVRELEEREAFHCQCMILNVSLDHTYNRFSKEQSNN